MCEVPTFARGRQIREALKDERVLIEIGRVLGVMGVAQ